MLASPAFLRTEWPVAHRLANADEASGQYYCIPDDNPWLDMSDGSANNPGEGCSGCHEPRGLREHHRITGANTCSGCHTASERPPAENIAPTYYGTPDAPNMTDPCNSAQAAEMDESFTTNDLVGLDNDGDGVYDGNDTDCQAGPAPGGAIYSPGDGTFTVSQTKVGSKAYDITMQENSNLLAGDPANAQVRTFTLSTFSKVTPTGTPDCTYTGSTGVLDCPTVSVTGLKQTYHVIFDKLSGGFTFQVRSAKKN